MTMSRVSAADTDLGLVLLGHCSSSSSRVALRRHRPNLVGVDNVHTVQQIVGPCRFLICFAEAKLCAIKLCVWKVTAWSLDRGNDPLSRWLEEFEIRLGLTRQLVPPAFLAFFRIPLDTP